MARFNPTPEMIKWLKDNYQMYTVPEMVPLFNERFSANRSIEQLRGHLRNHNIKSHKPNKGQFSDKGCSVRRVMPIGAERKSGVGYIEVKIAEPNVWVTKQRAVWMEYFGSIPEGHIVQFKDGDKSNFSPGNLYLVTRRESVLLNKKYKINDSPQQVRDSLILMSKLEVKTAIIEENS